MALKCLLLRLNVIKTVEPFSLKIYIYTKVYRKLILANIEKVQKIIINNLFK